MAKKSLIKIVFSLMVIILGGVGGVLADRYFFPYLSSTQWFSKYEFLKKTTEDVTIINKTEQITIKEDASISKVSGQIISSVVNVVSYPQEGLKTKKIEIKNGTGTIVTSDGLIMTHREAIVKDNARYKVFLNANDSYDAKLVGVDSFSNLAFLKIEAGNLSTLPLDNSDDSEPGIKVIAVGNSDKNFGLRYSASILGNFDPFFNLSGKTISSSEKMDGVFTSDFLSAKNLLGGPLVDYSGKVIGIVASVEKNGQEIFFEIPSNKIKLIINRAIRNELNQAPFLGIYYKPLSKMNALSEKNLPEKGALIYSASEQSGLAILAGSPAQKADLRLGDIIISLNGQEINAQNSLANLLYNFKKGDEITLKVLRAGQDLEVKVQL